MTDFSSLPQEMLLEIFNHLSHRDLTSAACTDKRSNRLASTLQDNAYKSLLKALEESGFKENLDVIEIIHEANKLLDIEAKTTQQWAQLRDVRDRIWGVCLAVDPNKSWLSLSREAKLNRVLQVGTTIQWDSLNQQIKLIRMRMDAQLKRRSKQLQLFAKAKDDAKHANSSCVTM